MRSKNCDLNRAYDGTLFHYTGESALTTVTISNPDNSEVAKGAVVQVYFQFDDSTGKLSCASGTFTLSVKGNAYNVTVVDSTVPYVYYAKLPRPKQGDTLSMTLGSQHRPPTADGGTAMVWGHPDC